MFHLKTASSIIIGILSLNSLVVPCHAVPLKIVSVDATKPHLPLLDKFGRERYFHGINYVVKFPPYAPIIDRFDPRLSFSAQDVDLLKRANWNIVRLGIMWPGAEPSRGAYNQTYFEIMKTVVARLNEADIYVLLDLHQDVLSEKFCGEGVPLWAAQPNTNDFPMPLTIHPYAKNASGVPSVEDCKKFSNMFDYLFSEAASSAYEALLTNKDGLFDALLNYWRKIVTEFKDFPNVIGYNLMNEPWPGNIYRHPSLLVPGVADRWRLQPLYNQMNAAIRELDNQTLIFFEGVTWNNLYIGFTESPGGLEYANRSVMSYHYYQPPRTESIEDTFQIQKDAAAQLKCGAMMTEFWASRFSNPSDVLRSVQAADKALQSWIGWQYKPEGPWLDNGTLSTPILKQLSRAYASAVCGQTVSMRYYDNQLLFVLIYIIETAVNVATEITLSSFHYSSLDRLKIDITPAGWATYQLDFDTHLLVVKHTDKAEAGKTLRIAIAPR